MTKTIIKCAYHDASEVDVREWPDENGKQQPHYFCRLSGDGTTECLVNITEADPETEPML